MNVPTAMKTNCQVLNSSARRAHLDRSRRRRPTGCSVGLGGRRGSFVGGIAVGVSSCFVVGRRLERGLGVACRRRSCRLGHQDRDQRDAADDRRQGDQAAMAPRR